jgi:hypothetical protein
MAPIKYILPRIVRRFLPEKLVRFLLLNSLVIRPGLETREPELAAERYQKDLAAYGVSLQGKRILILGFGGRFSVGCRLLRMGASHVVLCEREGFPNDEINRGLLPEFSSFLIQEGTKILPRPEAMSVIYGDIRELADKKAFSPADIVLTTSVYEHLNDVSGITKGLAELTVPGGVQLHYIDLRDHYFKYPFEMLCYSDSTWRNWLNPTSNLNRLRFGDYHKIFKHYFSRVELDVFERDELNWQASKSRIRPEFKTGDLEIDCVTQVKAVLFK